jgi:carbon-monoxide dehydrogenase medium subunit
MKAFDYYRPSTLQEACQLVSQPAGELKILAGGTDILVRMKHGTTLPKGLVSLRDIPDLCFIQFESHQGLTIGAMTPLSRLGNTTEIIENYPAIIEAVETIGSPQIRNRATLGGNICNAAPSADMVPILIAYGATVKISNGKAERSVLLEDFFTGPGGTVLKPGDLLTAVHIPPPPESSFGTYLKAYRSCMDCAIIGVALLAVFEPGKVICKDAKLVLGAVAPTPIRARASERMVAGKELDDELVEKASQKAAEDSRPITDIRSAASYRKTLVAVSTRRALVAARTWAQQGGNR